MRSRVVLWAVTSVVVLLVSGASQASAGGGSGVGNVPQGTQTNAAYEQSVVANGVTNVFATTQRTSCYTPEVPYAVNLGPLDGYTGESACNGAADTGEDLGPYSTQAGSNAGFPAAMPMLVKNHSESDIRVDPTDPNHLIASSKWFASSEGYNHVLGFYESFDGGATWPEQGHIPGYEGWTDNTDPVGAFDGFGNYYELILPYQFFYTKSGGHKYEPGNEPNPSVANEAVSVAVRPHGAEAATDWITTHNGQPDIVASTNAGFGQEPDKQWLTIDTNPQSPFYNTIYAMWVVFNGSGSKPFVSTAKALPDGTHTDWSPPQQLPILNAKSSNTYLLPHVAPDGTVYTSVTNFPGKHGQCCATITVDFSADGGKTWEWPTAPAASLVQTPPFTGYVNTTFRDGIENSFAVGTQLSAQGHYPLYVAWEDYSSGYVNVILSASDDGGATWSKPIQVNDNADPKTDEFQPQLAVAADGTVSVNFYDRRLACPASGTSEAQNAGLALDTSNPRFSGTLPPYGAADYCVNASIQFYGANLDPLGHNIRLTQHSWDPQLNAATWICSCNLNDTFIGDYFGNTINGSTDYSSFVSTYDDGTNPAHYQQQVVATIPAP